MWGVGRGICRQDASERDFVFTVNEPGRQRQIPQSVYNLWPLKLRLKRARRGQPSGATRQDKGKERKGKEEKHREICPAMLQGFQCCKRLSERPGKLMDVQSFSGTKNK